MALVWSASASQPILVDEKLVADGKIDIRPAYPAEAQALGLTGSGVYILHVDPKNGLVSSVAVEKSTGHKILDTAAVTTFSNLRFKPHGFLRVKIPVTFTMPQQMSRTPVTHNFPATWLAEPQQVRVTSGPAIGRR